MILLLKQICKNNLKNTIFFSIFDQVVSYLLCIAKGMKEMNVLRIETGRKRGADNFWGLPIFFPTPSHTHPAPHQSLNRQPHKKKMQFWLGLKDCKKRTDTTKTTTS